MLKRTISVLSDSEDNGAEAPRIELNGGNKKMRFDKNSQSASSSASDNGDSLENKRRYGYKSNSRARVHANLRLTLTASDLNKVTLKRCLEMILIKEHPKTAKLMRVRFANKKEHSEESVHPWAVPSAEVRPENGILFRVWDEISRASNKDNRIGFLSGGADWEYGLTTKMGRKLAIDKHSNWRQRKQTPFISTTDSWAEIMEDRVHHMEKRQVKKGIKPNTKITLFNSNARIAAKLPILRMREELNYYEVTTKYDCGGKRPVWYNNEYLLPFWSGPNEIVYTWTLDEIWKVMKNNKWTHEDFLQKVVVPKYKEHEAARLEGRKPRCGTACTCCGH